MASYSNARDFDRSDGTRIPRPRAPRTDLPDFSPPEPREVNRVGTKPLADRGVCTSGPDRGNWSRAETNRGAKVRRSRVRPTRKSWIRQQLPDNYLRSPNRSRPDSLWQSSTLRRTVFRRRSAQGDQRVTRPDRTFRPAALNWTIASRNRFRSCGAAERDLPMTSSPTQNRSNKQEVRCQYTCPGAGRPPAFQNRSHVHQRRRGHHMPRPSAAIAVLLSETRPENETAPPHVVHARRSVPNSSRLEAV